MPNRDRILRLIVDRPDLTDRQIREATGIEPHQQVNQICRRLEAAGLILRRPGPGGLITNRLAGNTGSLPQNIGKGGSRESKARVRPESVPTPELRLEPSRTLFVLPCSKSKRSGGSSAGEMPDLFNHLDPRTGERLDRARRSNAAAALLDESSLAPAWQRYQGTLYNRGNQALKLGVGRRLGIAIMSGGYGLCLATDPIGTYEAVFRTARWPGRVVENALAELASSLAVRTVVGVFASTTAYRRVFAGVRWPADMEVFIVTPVVIGGGAMRLVPAAIGELLEPLFNGYLQPGWRSSNGLGARVERII